VRGDAEHLAVAEASFDAVVMCLVIEHIENYQAAIREMARVLEPGGRCLLLLNHPLLQAPGSGWIDDHILEEQYYRVGAYLKDDVSIEELAPGVKLPFMHRPLSRYVEVVGSSGLLIEDMAEPPPPPGFLAAAWEYGEAATIPRLMLIRARLVT
jgi:SAM-dependent methyltransferase